MTLEKYWFPNLLKYSITNKRIYEVGLKGFGSILSNFLIRLVIDFIWTCSECGGYDRIEQYHGYFTQVS